ncbi:MAG: hypothetical protein RL685_5278 [Pseudomonadota bacterium]|jgi:hypothetical protein
MQKRSTAARGKPADSQRRPTSRSGQTQLVVAPSSGEVTLGGHADRGLTLAAFYETGVLDRLRLEVRARLIMDLTVSLAWLHANPRLMAAHAHLLIAPSTVVIGLDGVARVDVRAAKKASSEWSESEAAYAAPELALPGAAADQRADIYSLGVLTWEALAGHRLHDAPAVPVRGTTAPNLDDWHDELPATLAGPARGEREQVRRKPAVRTSPKGSHARLRLAPPPLTLPEDAAWAQPLLDMALAALNLDVSLRPQDCRSLLAGLESIAAASLAAHQEIAEVVQGICGVSTLCILEPTLPSVDASCQEPGRGGRGSASCAEEPIACFQAPSAPPPPRVHILNPFEPVAAPAPAPVLALPAVAPRGSVQPLQVWFGVALLWLATLGLVAGYVTAVMAHR